MDFSQHLSQLIARKGWSQNAAGTKLGVAGPFINQIIKGKRRPPLDRLDQWIRKLGMDAEEARTFKILAGLAHIKDAEVREIVRSELLCLHKEKLELTKSLLLAVERLPAK